MENKRIPRNKRNNNPLNIRRGQDKWIGLSAVQNDPLFCQFRSSDYGYRAAFVLLIRTYYYRNKITRLGDIIRRWAPPTENNTEAYILFVERLTGLKAGEQMPPPFENASAWLKLVAAMTIREGGEESLEVFALLDGWGMFEKIEKLKN